MIRGQRILIALLLAGGGLMVPSAAAAYAGPGGVVTGFGALLALVGAVLAAFFGFFWYPVKRAARWLHNVRTAEEANTPPARPE